MYFQAVTELVQKGFFSTLQYIAETDARDRPKFGLRTTRDGTLHSRPEDVVDVVQAARRPAVGEL